MCENTMLDLHMLFKSPMLKICQNTGFFWPAFFPYKVRIKQSKILCLYRKMWVRENPYFGIFYPVTAWKVSKDGVFSGLYFPVFGLNTGKYGAKKHRIWTLFTQWVFCIPMGFIWYYLLIYTLSRWKFLRVLHIDQSQKYWNKVLFELICNLLL